MQSMIQIKDGRPRNCARVCFDGSNDEFEQSFRGGIEGIRLWCYANRKRVRLPRIYRLNLEVFTTPAKGTFYLTLEYKRRYLALSFAGRDLYFMGWRSIHGTFELKPDSQKKGYMAGDCTILNIKKNYMFLAPDGEVGKTRMGPLALQQAFEILYKCRGQVSDQLMEAVGIFAVHFSESARIQDVLNDACLSIQGYDVPTLDSRNKNSYWVENWDNLAGVAMQRANCIDKGDPPPPIENPDGAPVLTSELQIFRQIRILPRDAYKEGIFRTEQRTSPVFEDPLDDVSSGVKSGNKRSRSEQKERGKKKVPRLEDHSKGEDEGYPAYSLLDEWGDAEISWHENQKDMKQEKENSGEIDDEEVQSSEEEQFDVKGKSAKTSGPADVSMDDYLDHFNIVKNMLKVNNTKTEQLELPISSSLVQRSIYPVAREMFPSYGIMRPNLKESTSIGGQKSGLVTHLRRPQLPCLQRNLLRACTLVTRFLKFV